ncbi:MAG TPA: retropepsin-like aspartic protease [Kofleriaceae bacterium]|jgi:hypothetical protein|nr:retropepsin-like aspartic protease [Kofleriaceae bacterium]
MQRTHGGLLALAVALVACKSTATPDNFLGGKADRWALPLVGPLEDNLLLTPVLLDGNGPYLFAIDPDANVSVVDEQVVREGRLAAVKGPARIDETNREHPRFYVDVRGLELGSLIVEHVTAMIVKTSALDTNGRRVHGVIGRDALADSLVFSFDRDQGVAYLTLESAYKPPAGAIALPYRPLRAAGGSARPLDRLVIDAKINDHPVSMHLDLGAPTSQLRESLWGELGLTAVDGHATLIDEVGSHRTATKVAVAENVTSGGAVAPRVVFVPYEDQRFPSEPAGTLALDFFRGYDVAADWGKRTFYLSPRTEVGVTERVARWEVGALGKCKSPGCAAIRLVDPMAGKPVDPARPHPGVVLSVTREEIAGGMDLEVVLEAKGKPELPRIVVNLSPSSDRVLAHLKPDWVGAELVIVDASPFARPCVNADGCVDLLAR